jgi:hypothetical protein
VNWALAGCGRRGDLLLHLRSRREPGHRTRGSKFGCHAGVSFHLLSTTNGKSPLAYPTRSFGDKTLVMPAWRLPKALLDACFGHFSAENYSERIDRTVRSRGLTHYLAHQLDSSYPGFGVSLLEGVRQTFQGKFANLTEQNFDLWVSEHSSPEARITMENICRKHIRS